MLDSFSASVSCAFSALRRVSSLTTLADTLPLLLVILTLSGSISGLDCCEAVSSSSPSSLPDANASSSEVSSSGFRLTRSWSANSSSPISPRHPVFRGTSSNSGPPGVRPTGSKASSPAGSSASPSSLVTFSSRRAASMPRPDGSTMASAVRITPKPLKPSKLRSRSKIGNAARSTGIAMSEPCTGHRTLLPDQVSAFLSNCEIAPDSSKPSARATPDQLLPVMFAVPVPTVSASSEETDWNTPSRSIEKAKRTAPLPAG